MATSIQSKNYAVIQSYGESDDIYSLAKRIKAMVPGGSKLADNEARALAQVALVTNCNPFIGEIWYIPGRGPMIGIRGARRHGNQQVKDAGGPQAYWTPDYSVCSPEEAGAKGVKDVEAAWKCVITDSVSTNAFQKMFLETVNSLRAAGDKDPVGTAREICGKRPQWIGYGYATTSEQSKMNKQAVARKRAEAEALKQRFEIPFGAEIASGDTASETEVQGWIETTPDGMVDVVDVTFPVPTQMTYEAARGIVALLFDTDPDKISREMLNGVYWSIETTDLQQEAIRLVLKEEYNAEAPEKPKQAEQIKKQLGF